MSRADLSQPADGGTDSAITSAFRSTRLHRDLGVTIEPCTDGVILRGQVGEQFARGDGLTTMHGGGVATLLDSALVWAAVVTTKRIWSTVDLRIDYLRPVPLGEVEVRGTVVYAGSTIARCRADLLDGDQRVLACAVATLAAEKVRPPAPSESA
jgi:uncharacterized protein (TIGR00369 family)